MKPAYAKREGGAALLALLAVLALGASWYLVNRLNADSGGVKAVNQSRNAIVLNRAKQALIGYLAAQAAKAGENNPGALPCPEAAGYFDNPTQDGQTASSCTLPKVGRFPWRTIGTDKLVDAAGEPLWYVVSPGWARTSGNTNINSNTVGQLTVDGAANAAVALIIAPGPAFTVPAAAGCAAWNQVRPTTGTPDWRNYLECENATSPADSSFVTTGPSGSFNDQVVRITVADIMPSIEAAIAHRIEREIVPVLKIVYADTQWGAGISPATPMFPFAVLFNNPGPGAGTSSLQGAAGTYQGLLPFNQTQGCTADPANPRCLPSLVAWSGTPANSYISGAYGSIKKQKCSWESADVRLCTGKYREDKDEPWQPIRIELQATFTNVAMGLRALDATRMRVEAGDNNADDDADDDGFPDPWLPQTVSYTATMNDGSIVGKPVGSVTITFGATLPNIDLMGWGKDAQFGIRLERAVISDHALLNPIDPPDQTPPGSCPITGCTGWFVRNEWYRLLYYAVARGHTADKLPPVCPTTVPFISSCLSVANVTPPNAQRVILILAGRSINGTARPSATLTDYLEFGNAKGTFERQTVTPAPPALYVDTGAANAYVVSAASPMAGTTLQFRAANSNTGASTLTTPATGPKNLVNLDGSNLAASTIQANAAVQVAYDGSQFLLSKRPFNDRIVVIDAN